eukprot:1573694-Pleurochrysis_carterae.AAC.1
MRVCGRASARLVCDDLVVEGPPLPDVALARRWVEDARLHARISESETLQTRIGLWLSRGQASAAARRFFSQRTTSQVRSGRRAQMDG